MRVVSYTLLCPYLKFDSEIWLDIISESIKRIGNIVYLLENGTRKVRKIHEGCLWIKNFKYQQIDFFIAKWDGTPTIRSLTLL